MVRLTEATVPAIVDVSEASLRLVCAVDREDSADVTDASSESIGLVDALGRLVARQPVLGGGELGLGRSRRPPWRAVVSTVASTCPAVTVWPAFTSTAVTVPETAKLRLAWLAGSRVPELATVCWMVPVVAVTVTVVTVSPVAVDDPDVNQRVSPTAAAIRTTTAPTMGQRYRRQTDRGSAKHVLVVERQLLGEIHWILRCLDRSRFRHGPSSDG